MGTVRFHYSITPVWDVVNTIEEKIKEAVYIKDKELFSATIMVVTELVENAIKYGKSNKTMKSIEIDFTADNKAFIVQVTNLIRDIHHLEDFKEHIHKINSCDNKLALYKQRLEELVTNPHISKARLGLYRIVYEGKYNLSYELKRNILVVNATRNLIEKA